MKFKPGDEVIWFDDLDRPDTFHHGTIEKLDKEWAWIAGEPRHQGFLFPSRVREEFLEIVRHRAELRKAWMDSMKLIYELNNAIIRGEK